jgi:hypothetical protein
MKTAGQRAFSQGFAFSLVGLARQHLVPFALHYTHLPNSSLLHHNVM